MRGIPMNQVKVLVVDDSPVCQLVLQRVLDKPGCNTIAVGNAQEAIRIADNHNFDYAFIDFCMPTLTGDILAKYIKETSNKRGHKITIFIVTALDAYDAEAIEKESINGWLVKPVCITSIREALTGVS